MFYDKYHWDTIKPLHPPVNCIPPLSPVARLLYRLWRVIWGPSIYCVYYFSKKMGFFLKKRPIRKNFLGKKIAPYFSMVRLKLNIKLSLAFIHPFPSIFNVQRFVQSKRKCFLIFQFSRSKYTFYALAPCITIIHFWYYFSFWNFFSECHWLFINKYLLPSKKLFQPIKIFVIFIH